MHVLMLCALEVWALPGGGGAPTLYRTLEAYSRRGHRVTFVAPTIGANRFSSTGRLRDAQPASPPDLPGVSFERFHLPSLQESRLPLPGIVTKADQKLRFALLYPILAARRARRVLRSEQVDLLYAYEVHGALAARLLRRRPGVRRLPTIARFQGTIMYPALASVPARLRMYEEVLALRLPADLYLMTNDGTRGDEALARLNPAATAKLRFWRNGLDLERLQPAEQAERLERRRALGLPDDALVLLTASRLAAWKRIDRAIAALPDVLRSLPNALLLIVGDGEERTNLERQARELGVEASVRFVGAVPQEEVVGYMQAADVFLALADLSNVGNPLLEAMSCGLPIVTVDAGATGELIRDGETGRLLASGDATLVARAVVALGEDAPERARLGSGARRYASEQFWTWEARLQAELEEVERLVGETVGADVVGAARG
ncbi:MAG: glycosyltransferase family 4 protein [Chloroflexi bacterium]|nr:glycosyltransferase family 4 protein [Chloroflexota bacterium]